MTRDELEEAALNANLALEIASIVAAEMLSRGGAKPVMKTRLGDAIRPYEASGRSNRPVERIRRALMDQPPLDREMKRETPR